MALARTGRSLRYSEAEALSESRTVEAHIHAVERLTGYRVQLVRSQLPIAGDGNGSVANSTQRNLETVAKAMAFVEAHLAERLTTRLVAQEVGLSVEHFCRVFKQSTGMSFKRYVCRARVDKAKGLLGDLSQSVKAIALECGFHSPRHFYRIFRRYTGCTALEHRAKLRR